MLSLHDYLFCLLGWILLNIYLFNNDKNEFDRENRKFSLKKYLSLIWDDWLFTFSSGLILLLVSPQLFGVLVSNIKMLKGVTWESYIPLSIGSFGAVIFRYLYKLIKSYYNKLANKITEVEGEEDEEIH